MKSLTAGLKPVGIIAGMLASWLLASAGLMATTELAPGALVLWPSRALLDRLPEGVRILDLQNHRLLVTSDQPGYVSALYKAGARLVLPARKNGCVALRIPGAPPIRPNRLTLPTPGS